MILARQLRLLFAGLALLVFAAVSLAGVWSSRQALEAELGAQARAIAEVVADRLVSEPGPLAPALDAVLATQPPCSVRIVPDAGTADPVARATPPAPAAVPGWFAVLFPVASAEAAVPVGASGRLTLRLDPAPATEQLWQAASRALVPGVASSLLVLVIGLLAVGPLTRPLRQLEREADAALAWEPAGDLDDPPISALPATRRAIRELSRRARLLLDGAQGLAATLHERASRDPLTGLASRHRLLDVLDTRRRDPEQAWNGALLIVRLDGLKGTNETFGYAAGDDVLRECARLLEETFGGEPGALVAHLAGGEFAVLVPCAGEKQVAGRVAAAEAALASLESRLRFPSSLVAFVGGAFFHGQGVSALFAEGDRALRQAQWQGIPGLEGHGEAPAQGADDCSSRHAAARRALQRGGLRLVLQPVVACETRELLHHEAYARLHTADDGEACPIGELVGGGDPALAVALDRAALAAAFRLLAAGGVGGDLALNLSPASVHDPELADWLEARCREDPAAARRLILELADASLPGVQARLATLLDRVRPLGPRLGIDHFGAGPAAFGHLRSLAPSHLKIDGSFAARLDRDPEAQCFVRATAQIAHGLGIPCLLEAVESEAVWAALPGLQLDGAQGYHLGRPR